MDRINEIQGILHRNYYKHEWRVDAGGRKLKEELSELQIRRNRMRAEGIEPAPKSLLRGSKNIATL